MSSTAEVFDFIVTGAGSAGCPIAARLSENGKYRVLLLEAGPSDWHPWFHIPLGHAKTLAHPRYNWMFESDPEKELNGRTLYQPRGKVLGGTSSINGMIYMRGTAADYEGWRQQDCDGWGWENVLPFFKKAEHQERGADAFHGVGGPLSVSNAKPNPFGDAMVQASVETGIPFNPDFNGVAQEGVGYYQKTVSNGIRCSAAKAYLHPARHRPNLTVITNAHVTRVLIEHGRAAGVEYRTRDGLVATRCRGEVIVSGGVYGSPQLLQLSGLGPGALLQEFDIPVVRDMSGVGANLHDHFNTYLVWRCLQKVTVNDLAKRPLCMLKAAIDYVFTRSGYLAHGGAYVGAMVKSDSRLNEPDLQINMWGGSAYNRQRDGFKPHPFSAFTFSIVHLRPDGRGTVKIKSRDPLAPPAILFNFLASDNDFHTMFYGIRLARKIAAQPALKPFVGEEIQPGETCVTDEQIVEDMRARGVSNMHPVGTCRMGREVDAVVDPRLRVYGVKGLRVADCSIMPLVPGGNTNAPSIMIGEKCAHMVLEDARAA